MCSGQRKATSARPAPDRSSAPRAAATKFGSETASSPFFIEPGSATSRNGEPSGSTRAAARDLHLLRERAVGDRVRAEQLVAVAARPSTSAATAPSPKLNMKRERSLP